MSDESRIAKVGQNLPHNTVSGTTSRARMTSSGKAGGREAADRHDLASSTQCLTMDDISEGLLDSDGHRPLINRAWIRCNRDRTERRQGEGQTGRHPGQYLA